MQEVAAAVPVFSQDSTHSFREYVPFWRDPASELLVLKSSYLDFLKIMFGRKYGEYLTGDLLH